MTTTISENKKSNQRIKPLTNLQKRQRLQRSRRDSRRRKMKKYRPLCVSHKFIEYALREEWDDETVDAAAMMTHLFFLLRKYVKRDGWLAIPFQTLEGLFGMDYIRIRDNLIAIGFLDEDEKRKYKIRSYCRYFRICQELRDEQVTPQYYPQSERLQTRFIDNKERFRRMSQAKRQAATIAKIERDCGIPTEDSPNVDTKRSYYRYVREGYMTREQLQTIEKLASNAQLLKLQITDAEFSEIAQMRYARRKRSDKYLYDAEDYEHDGRERLENFDFKVDKYGRYYTRYTGMFRELWDYIYFKKQQLVAVDVKTSHAVCILALLRDIEINYFGTSGSYEERLSKCQFERQIRMTPSLVGYLCWVSQIYPALPCFECKKRLPSDPSKRQKIMYELFKKFTKLHLKSIGKVYRNFEYYIHRNFRFSTGQRNLYDYLNFDSDSNSKYLNSNTCINSCSNQILDSNLHDLDNSNEHDNSNSLSDIPSKSITCTPSLNSGTIVPQESIGVTLQNELYQQVMNNLRACRFWLKSGYNPDNSTDSIFLFRSLIFPSQEEIAEYERLLSGDIYALLMASIGFDPEERDQFKEHFFPFLYRPAFSRFNKIEHWEDGTVIVEKEEAPVRKSMEELVPSILFFLDLIKCQPGTLKRRGAHYKEVPHLILRIESQIMLETCANLWKKNQKMFLTTLHDCIRCLPKDVAKVEAELQRTFAKYHVSPKFKTKEHKRPSDVNG